MIKKIAIAAAVVASVAMTAGVASAHKCYARSPRATGWGVSGSIYTARAIALRECAVRTPRGLVCVITSCY